MFKKSDLARVCILGAENRKAGSGVEIGHLPSPFIDFNTVSISIKFGRSCKRKKENTNYESQALEVMSHLAFLIS